MIKRGRGAKNRTVVAIVLDRSGSMQSVARETRSGFNEYVTTLENDKNADYSVHVTLFDTEVEKRHSDVRPQDVEELDDVNYAPDGMTALYDAAMSTISKTQQLLKEGEKVLFVIMTDGGENSSKEHTRDDFQKKVKELEKAGNWSFVFLGANQDAWANAQHFGFMPGNVVTYTASGTGVRSAFATVASNTTAFAMNANMTTDSFFSDKDKENLAKG